MFYYLPPQPATEEFASGSAREDAGNKLGEKLGETRAAIVSAMLANSNITVVKLAQTLHISTTAVEKNLQYLKRQGYIERIGPAKGAHWKVCAGRVMLR